MQLLVAMHRAAHVHGLNYSSTVRDHGHAHTDRSQADPSRAHEEPSPAHTGGLFSDHFTKADCDRFDACAGSDIVAAHLSETRFPLPELMSLTRVDVALIATQSLRATARAPPLALT
jgi:hypothetical protein